MSGTTFRCEYVWLDGGKPEPSLRSKTMVNTIKEKKEGEAITLSDFPIWGFDGSSTQQAVTGASDRVLRPVFICADPNRTNAVIVLCDVLNVDFSPHSSNTRAPLIAVMNQHIDRAPVIGFEQEYFFKKDGRILGWPEDGSEPAPQGPYYCAVGSENVVARDIVESHLTSCINAGLSITGVNAEVSLGQWEYQIGGPMVNALAACDHLIVARYILERLGEKDGVSIELAQKPVKGDWNGSGMHANFSTSEMREADGIKYVIAGCKALGLQSNVDRIADVYGSGLEERLTGLHETSAIDSYSYGVSDRSASVRIPWNVDKSGRGYLEDRRPGSNADPYLVAEYMVSSICSAFGPEVKDLTEEGHDDSGTASKEA
jgi:glutamine synthetase